MPDGIFEYTKSMSFPELKINFHKMKTFNPFLPEKNFRENIFWSNLIRRLAYDEELAEESFLKSAFNLIVDTRTLRNVLMIIVSLLINQNIQKARDLIEILKIRVAVSEDLCPEPTFLDQFDDFIINDLDELDMDYVDNATKQYATVDALNNIEIAFKKLKESICEIKENKIAYEQASCFDFEEYKKLSLFARHQEQDLNTLFLTSVKKIIEAKTFDQIEEQLPF